MARLFKGKNARGPNNAGPEQRRTRTAHDPNCARPELRTTRTAHDPNVAKCQHSQGSSGALYDQGLEATGDVRAVHPDATNHDSSLPPYVGDRHQRIRIK
jgi:hypothetical protein